MPDNEYLNSLPDKVVRPILQRLDDYENSPLLPLELESIQRKLKDSRSSTESFKLQYLRDPVFCWMLVSAAREATRNRQNQPFAADHAMSLLGLGAVKSRFSSLKAEDQPKLSEPVRFHLTASLLAAELAHHIGARHSQNNQRYWNALAYLLPETLLWHVKPNTMWQIAYRQLTIPRKLALFEESKLGFNTQQWRLAVAERLQMDDALRRIYLTPLPQSRRELLSYSRNGLDNQCPSLKIWHKSEPWLILLANRLAKSILLPWQNTSYGHTFDMLKQTTGMDNKKLTRVIGVCIRNVTMNLDGSALMSPANAFLFRQSRPALPEFLIQAPPLQARRKPASKPKPAKTDLANILKKLLLESTSFESSAALVHFGLQALIDQLGFSRATFLSVNHKTRQVETRIALCESGAKKIRPDFSFEKSTPLSRFIDDQAFMILDKNKHQKVWPKLPSAVQKSGSERFLLTSLKPGKQVKAIIYADSKNKQCYSPESLPQVKRLIKAINQGLVNRNQARNNSASPHQKATGKPVPRQKKAAG